VGAGAGEEGRAGIEVIRRLGWERGGEWLEDLWRGDLGGGWEKRGDASGGE